MNLSSGSFIYKLLIDPVLSRLHDNVLKDIGPSDKVIDVACGTGSLTLAIAGKAKSVMGIDISEDMISTARRSTNRRQICNAAFMVLDAADMGIFRQNEYDVAVISMAIHQFEPELALDILYAMKTISRKIIIVDYNYPIPEGFYKKLVSWIERMAGEEHNRNFKTFINNGGIYYYTSRSELTIRTQKVKNNGIFIICSCQEENS